MNYERKYREKYASFGEEYKQRGIPEVLIQHLRSKRDRRRAELEDSTTSEGYWKLRQDDVWSEIPSKKVYSRKYRKSIYMVLVREILISLQPATTFNPLEVWNAEKKREEELLASLNNLDSSGTTETTKGKGAAPLKKTDLMIVKNTQRKLMEQELLEVNKIRNFKSNLKSLIRQVKTRRGREILLVEILRKAVAEKKLAEVFDVLWAIELLTLSEENAPPPNPSDIQVSMKDAGLVYDNFQNVVALLQEARQLRNKEPDIIRFQLNEMSNRLPPLSVYSFGFRLDDWQKRALLYIDAGKSVIICAPTSSGKTVLSTYVALIGSKRLTSADQNETNGAVKSAGNKPKELKAEAGGEKVEFLSDEESSSDDEDDEDEEEEADNEVRVRRGGVANVQRCLPDLERLNFRRNFKDGTQRVLFVVPTEPLVWQVAAFFTKLLREEGGASANVAIVTNQMVFHQGRKLGIMPQIVVGTPLALESALTKPRGLVGKQETSGRAVGVILPGGFDHFDWAIYDEVHAVDGEEGDALQRIIRAMNCKFLALSATVGNAEELRGWMERAKGDLLEGAEMVTVLPSEASYYGTADAPVEGTIPIATQAGGKERKGKSQSVSQPVSVSVRRVLDGFIVPVGDMTVQNTVAELKNKIWLALPADERDPLAISLCLRTVGGDRLTQDSAILDAFVTKSKDTKAVLNIELITFHVRVSRTLDSEFVVIKHVSPLTRMINLKSRVASFWPLFGAHGWQVRRITTLLASNNGVVAADVSKGSISLNLVMPAQVDVCPGSTLLIEPVAGSTESPELVNVCIRSAEVSDATPEGTRSVTVHTSKFCLNHAAGSTCSLVSVFDLTDNTKTVEEYGLFNSQDPSSAPLLQALTLVNLLSHQVRFINLQRFAWHNGNLNPISPLAAVDSVAHLQQGILSHSNLSFTSEDCYRLWVELEKLYPRSVIAQFDPHVFFDANTRITLQKSKDYEDLLKIGLRELALRCPVETQELLYKFRLEEPDKKVDFCEVVLKLKADDKLPCLAFHRNSFEAIRLFQQLVAGLEFRQKRDHPMYYTALKADKAAAKKSIKSKEKSFGGNEKNMMEAQKAGDLDLDVDVVVNEHEPHPNYRFCLASVMNDDEFAILSAEMERFDGFVKRDASTMADQPGKNDAVLSHALMRGLRRGIGLYINEVSCPAYRRAVQRLASQGKLAAVVSDDSLAFGVNMPFRTCLFCGEMEGQLTPLMAQQMSGRAGRRGLDTEGNLVYVGSRPSFVQAIMIGQVANITGSLFPPRYATCFLQGALSPRHVGWSRMQAIAGRSLEEFVIGEDTSPADNLERSKQTLIDLNLITADSEGNWEPTMQREVLSMVWQLRGNVNESVCIGQLLPQLYNEIEQRIRDIKNNQGSDQAFGSRKDKDLHQRLVPMVFSIILQICDRFPRDPESTLPPLHEHHHFSSDRPIDRDVFFHWTDLIRENQESLPPHLQHMRLPVDFDTPLDATFFQCVLDQHFIYSLTDRQKQQMKARMWHVGTTIQIMWNSLWPCPEFYEIFGCLHTCFRHLWYLNTELVRSQINFTDISAAERESKNSGPAKRIPQAELWSDNDESDATNVQPVSIAIASDRIVGRMKEWIRENPDHTKIQLSDVFFRLVNSFQCFKHNLDSDLTLLRLGYDYKANELPAAVATFSASSESPSHLIGTLLWFFICLCPKLLPQFPVILNKLIEEDLIAPEDILAWAASSAEDNKKSLPNGSCQFVSVEAIEKVKSSAGMVAFLNYLNLPEEEGDEEEEEEEDEEEEN